MSSVDIPSATMVTNTIEARALTTTGQLQTEEKVSSFPDGASGLHTSHVWVVPAG